MNVTNAVLRMNSEIGYDVLAFESQHPLQPYSMVVWLELGWLSILSPRRISARYHKSRQWFHHLVDDVQLLLLSRSAVSSITGIGSSGVKGVTLVAVFTDRSFTYSQCLSPKDGVTVFDICSRLRSTYWEFQEIRPVASDVCDNTETGLRPSLSYWSLLVF